MQTKADPFRHSEAPPSTTTEGLSTTPAQRVALRQSLIEAEGRMRSGDFVQYDPQVFEERLQQAHTKAKQAKTT